VALSGLLQANVLLVECLVLGLGTTDLVLRARDLFLALVNLEEGLLELGLELGTSSVASVWPSSTMSPISTLILRM
jgi:hypothetical protein